MKLTSGQKAVLRAFSAFPKADDVTLTVYVHHVAGKNMSSSGIRTRRNELVRKGLITVTGVKRAKSGRNAAIHGLTPAGRLYLSQLRRAEARAKVAV